MDQFLLSGRMGMIEIGTAISDVFRILGDPQDHGEGLGGDQIEAYNGRSLEITHHSNVVALIAVYFKAGLSKNWKWPNALQVEVPFSERTTIGQFREYLDQRRIPWTPSYAFPDSNDVNLKVGRNVHASFRDGYLVSLQSAGNA